jgi:hypothetical protein
MSKHAGGRPLLYNTEQELQEAIDKYFDYCENNESIIIKNGETIKTKNPLIPCIAGLAYYLGVDRQTIYNYEKKEKFFGTIKKARDYILYRLEESTVNSESNVTGKIWISKQYGYTDKSELDVRTLSLNQNIDYSSLSEDEAKELFKKKQEELRNGG